MSSQFLQSELLNLIQECKRKNSDLRNAAEQSLAELKALPSTSEAQVAADLCRRPTFVDPFVLACHAKQAKLAGIGVHCLQRLVTSRALPSERLGDVLLGLREATSLSLDIQLKILQTLPSLLQCYSHAITGDLLAVALEVCSVLQASKTAAVSSTAAATLQQLVVTVFDRVATEDKFPDTPKSATISVDGHPLSVGPFANDAHRVLVDMCRLLEGEPLQFIRLKSTAHTFILDLIENVLINGDRIFSDHPELAQVLRSQLMPITIRYLSERHSFGLTARIARILLVLLKRHMELLVDECEMALGLLTHLLEPDGNSPWKRVLCMELFRSLYSEPALVRLIYSLYDAQEGRKNVIRDHVASFVRVASEKPALLGISNQSTVPLRGDRARSATEEQITFEAGGVADVIGTALPASDATVPGLSSQWSVVRVPYIELLDKSDAPPPPDTYIYCIVLNCISALSEGLARFILPLTVPESKQKRKHRAARSPENSGPASDTGELQSPTISKQGGKSIGRYPAVPVNPLELSSHPQLASIKICAAIIENCWPAILATCSTFLYASLDDEFYHNLVRSVQKLAHVAGLLRLSVPRDAFLTTLGKAAVPSDASGLMKAGTISGPASDVQSHASSDKMRKGGAASSRTGLHLNESPAASTESNLLTPLNTRNLLCLRALLNIGIALGPTLDRAAWSIILSTLQDDELLMSMSSLLTPRPGGTANNAGDEGSGAGIDELKASLGAEIIAVQSASTKMFESTGDYPSDAFRGVLVALLDLSGSNDVIQQGHLQSAPVSPSSPRTQRNIRPMHKSTRSITLSVGKLRVQDEALRFVLDKMTSLTRANVERLSTMEEQEQPSWLLFSGSLISIAADSEVPQLLRVKACSVLNECLLRTMQPLHKDGEALQNSLQVRNLETLKMLVKSLYEPRFNLAGVQSAGAVDVHERELELLKDILEQSAETLVDGWRHVFDLISSVFETPTGPDGETVRGSSRPANSLRLVRAAFKSLHLIASDFLSLLPTPCLLTLVDEFSMFAAQQQDFNISLTTTSFFWNLSDFLQGQIERFSVESHVDDMVSEEKLVQLAKSAEPSASRNSLWLLLLLRIVDISTDSRCEIRNSAVRTLLRIFDAYGQQLSPEAWCLCLNRVLFRMVEDVETKLLEQKAERSSSGPDQFKEWVDTAVVMVKGSSELIANFLDTIIRAPDFERAWTRFLAFYKVLIDVGCLDLSEATFGGLLNILNKVQDDYLSQAARRSAWELWVNGNPAGDADSLDVNTPNQDASEAYLKCFEQLYRLLKHDLVADDIVKVLQSLRLLVWNSVFPRYSSDSERTSPLQGGVIDYLRLLCEEQSDSQSDILICVADFVDSPLTKGTASNDARRPTFIAFAKSVADLISWYYINHGIKQDIFSNGSLATLLEHIRTPIIEKYRWQGKDREPQLWRKATTACLDVLQVAVPYVETHYTDCNSTGIARFWRCVVDIARGVISAQGDRLENRSTATVLSDQAFDMDAFGRLKGLIIPALGCRSIPDDIRQDFAYALCHSSFIYPLQRHDLPAAVTRKPLEDLYKIRPGRTFDLLPTQRSHMVYDLMDTLFELASTMPRVTESNATTDPPSYDASAKPTTEHGAKDQAAASPARIALARAVFPYLILRCAVALKSYIADQPLRGLMPQPTPARRALLHLLNGMVDLRTDPSTVTVPDSADLWIEFRSNHSDSDSDSAATSTGTTKKHLLWIYPLVVKAVQVAGRERDDGKVLQVLGRVLEEVGRA